MRRIVRRLFTLCPAASLVLCVAVCVLWVRGYLYRDTVWLAAGTDRPSVAVATQRGTVSLVVLERSGRSAGLDFALGGDHRSSPFEDMRRHRDDPRWSGGGGFAFHRSYGFRQWLVAVPNWFLLLVTGIPLFGRAFAVGPRRRRAAGLCPFCSYDLRATPGRCPECGGAAAVSPP